MLQIAICEDSSMEAVRISSILERYQSDHPQLKLITEMFPDAEQLLEAFTGGRRFDLYLLDILMPGIDGIALAKRLRLNGQKSGIIFCTSSPDFALDAFSVSAINYLLKPITPEKLFHVLDDAIAALGSEVETYTSIKTPKGEYSVRISDIVCTEITGHKIRYDLLNSETIFSKVLRISFEEAVAELLSDRCFLRPHRSFLINANHVAKLCETEFIMVNGIHVPISRLRFSDVKTEYMKFQAERFSGRNTREKG